MYDQLKIVSFAGADGAVRMGRGVDRVVREGPGLYRVYWSASFPADQFYAIGAMSTFNGALALHANVEPDDAEGSGRRRYLRPDNVLVSTRSVNGTLADAELVSVMALHDPVRADSDPSRPVWVVYNGTASGVAASNLQSVNRFVLSGVVMMELTPAAGAGRVTPAQRMVVGTCAAASPNGYLTLEHYEPYSTLRVGLRGINNEQFPRPSSHFLSVISLLPHGVLYQGLELKWVLFQGLEDNVTVSVIASVGVQHVEQVAFGQFRLDFDQPFATPHYAVFGLCNAYVTNGDHIGISSAAAQTAASVEVDLRTANAPTFAVEPTVDSNLLVSVAMFHLSAS